MAECATVTTLRNKCVEIEHRISAYEQELEIARKNLVAVQMTLAVFPPISAGRSLQPTRCHPW